MCLKRWLAVVMDLLASGIAVIVITILVKFKGSVNGAQVGLAFNIILVMNTTLLRLIESWTSLEVTLGAVYRLRQFDAETPQEGFPTENLQPGSGWPTSGAVSIENLQVAYKYACSTKTI